jgi:DNA-binding MarR family transcriptional regulator
MSETNETNAELAEEAGELALELLRRLDLLAGAGVHDDISCTKYKVLSVIRSHGTISVGNLARAIGSAQSTASEMLARLEKAGLVTKVRNALDGRAVIVETTDRGGQLVERHRRRVHERYVSLLTGLSLVERDTFLSALKQLDALLHEVDDAKETVPAKEAAPTTGAAPRHDAIDRWKAQSVRTFSVLQVARMCRVSRRMIRKWVSRFGLPAYNTTGGLAFVITEPDLREFSERMRVYVDWKSVGEKG